MKYLEHLNLKSSHFNNGVASFDQVSHSDIIRATSSGADYDRMHVNNLITIDIITKNREIMAFGKIDKNGIMTFEGISGFPFDSKCVEYVSIWIKGSKNSKINHNMIFVEW